MRKYEFEALGTIFSFTIWDEVEEGSYESIKINIVKRVEEFESLYSRFRADSLLSRVNDEVGVIELPEDFVKILKIYKSLYIISDKKFTPLIGNMLEDAGYDMDKTLTPKEKINEVQELGGVIRILDDTHIEKFEKCKLDFGAVGKGYLVDLLSAYLKEENIKSFVVDGSGDFYYSGSKAGGESQLTVGLEHPDDTSKVIGALKMGRGALCSSATNKRVWDKYSHYIDPVSKSSPTDIIATWVMADNAAISDALTSVLFFALPESVSNYEFEFCVLYKDYNVKYSAGFTAEYF